MFTRKTLISALIAVGALTAVAAPLPSLAESNFHFGINVTPAAPSFETAPVAHRDFWVQGHWRWSNYRQEYVWVPGHWQRRDFDPRFDRGYDRTPYAYGGQFRDRDGDGVPNRFDRFPDNPYYR